jgi:hypothetical protein
MSKSLKLFNTLFLSLIILPALILTLIEGGDSLGQLLVFFLLCIYFFILFLFWWLPRFIKLLRENPMSKREKVFKVFVFFLTIIGFGLLIFWR